MKQNRLVQETSPYLQQHAGNPVEWYPWGDEALEKARREDKPILLSIGYSACHWCHVMAHESFEDPQIAEVMNEWFVNVKVDREERPDLDKVYQLAHQILTRRPGGWPLNVFLTPDRHIPFFSGTYFPKRPTYNLPAFADILRSVADYYQRQKLDLAQHSANFESAIEALSAPPASESAQATLLDEARREIESLFDPRHGGMGQAPKFPHSTTLEFLLHHWDTTGRSDEKALHMAVKSLEMMARGGIYDHLGGGFCRYSVDERWRIPHFEKMLYDNGLLLALYSRAWQATAEPLFEKSAKETAEWVMREMESAEGGYYSSLDADSEGEEGKFYVWDREEIKELLTEEEYRLVLKHFGLDQPANFEGRWHLFVNISLTDAADAAGIDREKAGRLLASARSKLFEAREKRIRPGRDEKILTSWNALMIKGMAIAGKVFDREDFLESALGAFDFLRETVWREGRLCAAYKDGRSHLNAYLDDYVYLLDAGLELLEARWNTGTVKWLITLADSLLDHYQDPANGGFLFTADDHETLLQRPRPLSDDATPAGNAIAALALARLGCVLGEARYIEAARRCVETATASIKRIPSAHCAFLIALEEILYPHVTVIIRGEQALSWQRAALSGYAPRRLCFAIPDGESGLPGMLSERKLLGETTAYLCSESACLPPFEALDELKAALEAR